VPQLTFKFRNSASEAARKKLFQKLLELSGDADVRPLLPGEDDDELSRIFVVHFEGVAGAKPAKKSVAASLSALLESDAAVEFVEGAIKRKAT